MSDLVLKAYKFASAAHAGQVRKYTNEPYFMHPVEVSNILLDLHISATTEMVAAALLHDVVEDTEITQQQIVEEFDEEVGNLVYWLTDVSRPEDGNRATRKALDRDHISKAPFEAQVIKCADLISNTTSIAKHDKNFAKVYLKEKRAILDIFLPSTKKTQIFRSASQVLRSAEMFIKESE